MTVRQGVGALTLLAMLTAASRAAARVPPPDSAAVVALEHTWLQAADTAVLARILAPDFVHIAPGGYLLTRTQHLAWVATHPRRRGVRRRFVRLDVRVYGAAAVANGIVVGDDSTGHELWRNAFTDVFVKRSGRWRAVNAQEDAVAERHVDRRRPPAPPGRGR